VSAPEPATIGWNPSAADGITDRLLLAGDEVALPCIRTILKTLSPKARGQVFVEVQSADDIVAIDAPGRFSIVWLVRDRGQQLQRSVDAWLSEMLPVSGYDDFAVYAWIAGSGQARLLTSN
jgi:NADPH-dependent ferric siderophore reductase